MLMNSKILGVCFAAFLLVGCDEEMFGRSDRFTEDFSYQYDLKAGGRVSLETMNGSVEIAGWDRDSIEIRGTKYASTEENLRAMKIDIQRGADYVNIRTIRPSSTRWGNLGAKYTIRVPRRVDLERIISSNGHIEVRDVEGPGRLRTSNAHVRVADAKGNFEIETSNGHIEAIGHSGAINGHTSNAHVTAELRDPERGKPVRLESSNGSIKVRMNQLNDNSIRLSTSNASITLALPENAGAQLRASTSNASVRTDLPLNGRVEKHSAEGKLGAGGPYIDLTTSNGGINIDKL